jgi:hypothetical protein
VEVVLLDRTTGKTVDYCAANNGGDRFFSWGGPQIEPPPSTRAAIVLSAVGADWKESGF